STPPTRALGCKPHASPVKSTGDGNKKRSLHFALRAPVGMTVISASLSPAKQKGMRMRLIGVDVGGTFTDLVYADTDAGRTAVHKVSTTPDDPSRGVVQGLMALCDRYGIPRSTIDVVFHGTTIATNSILEHDGAVTGMITTGGYRDILHIGRHQRP